MGASYWMARIGIIACSSLSDYRRHEEPVWETSSKLSTSIFSAFSAIKTLEFE